MNYFLTPTYYRKTRMVLTLYKMDASPPVRAVYMVIEELKLPNINYVDMDLLRDDHLKDDFLKVREVIPSCLKTCNLKLNFISFFHKLAYV